MGKWWIHTVSTINKIIFKKKEKKKENGANSMIQAYQWQCNADSSRSSEYYRLQLFVAVDFMPEDPSGIWRAGSNTVVAIKSSLGWKDLRWALWSVPCERKLCFESLRTFLSQPDDSLEAWESRDGATWSCRMVPRKGESGREASVQYVFCKGCLSVQNHVNLPVLSHWLLGHSKVSVNSTSRKDRSLPVPGLHFHV